VRFTPTTTTTVSASLNFATGGGTISPIVTGSGIGAADSTSPSVAITSPTTSSTYVATGSSITLKGTAADNVGVTQVTWVNSLGGSGAATGTSSWTTSPIALQLGSNTVTVTARDAAGNTGTANLTVTLSNTTPAAGGGATDSTAPVISKTTLSVTPSGATVGWTTNELSDSQLEYGLTTSYGNSTTLDQTLVPLHLQTISGLTPNTWYHFRIKSKDAAGNLGVSGDFKFKTRNR